MNKNVFAYGSQKLERISDERGIAQSLFDRAVKFGIPKERSSFFLMLTTAFLFTPQ